MVPSIHWLVRKEDCSAGLTGPLEGPDDLQADSSKGKIMVNPNKWFLITKFVLMYTLPQIHQDYDYYSIPQVGKVEGFSSLGTTVVKKSW
jgi:hypothetical protein